MTTKELSDKLNNFKKNGYVKFNSFNDPNIDIFEKFLKRQRIEYGETSELGNDLIVYSMNSKFARKYETRNQLKLEIKYLKEKYFI